MKDEIIGSPPLPVGERENIQRSTVSDPTFSKTAVLCSNVTLQYMERTIKAIDRALIQLDELHNEIFEQRYRQNKNWRQTLSEVCIGQDTYFKKRRELIIAVAMQLGFIDPF